MPWTDRLLPASFRGIPFFIDTHEFRGGRNVVSHEPPEKNASFGEDMGRRTQVYRLEGHVLGETYSFIRDALINAMEDGSKGILVHPYLGPKEVFPSGFSFSEDTTEGRIGRFILEFVEAGDPSFPFAIIDAVTDFAAGVVATVAGVQNLFQLAYSVSRLPGFAIESAELIAADFEKTVGETTSNISKKDEESSDLESSQNAFSNNIATLVRNPASLVAELDSILSQVRDVVDEPPARTTIDVSSGRDDSISVFDSLVAFNPEAGQDIPTNTPTRTVENANANALVSTIKQLAIIKLAENAIAKEYTSTQEAIDLRNRITDLIEAEMIATDSDELYELLADFKAKVAEALPPANLQSIKSVELLDSQPALVLSYDLYESLDNELDLIERNKVENPAFIVGDIEVLSGS